MRSTLKVWTGLGVATALVGAGLAGCAGENSDSSEGDEASAEASLAGEGGEGERGEGEGGEGEGGEGEGGEGEGGEGEGGEGGVSVAEAVSDPVIYGAALAIVEAHAVAARDAYNAGKSDEAAEMFGHPVSEVLADMAPVFDELGVEDFTAEMNAASAAALEPDNTQGVESAYQAILTRLKEAGAKGPAGDASAGAVAAGIVSDQIDRATTMYGQAAGTDIYPPYLDGYGFYKAASAVFERSGASIETYNSGLHSDIKAALGLLGEAYPSAERPAALEVEQGQLLGAASKVKLGLPTT
ncbi:MAG: hypothetical protein AAF559_10685 [Pseudomonadota bacterium]